MAGVILVWFMVRLLEITPTAPVESPRGTGQQGPLETNPTPPDAVSASTAWMHPWALIKSGNNPLWFELGAEGSGTPVVIPSPAEASLKPFTPWPLAKCITGMVIREDRLTLAINREGFLIACPEQERGVALYRIADVPYWSNYTIGSVFLYKSEPAVLLYRNDFFVDPTAAPPDPRVLALVKGSTQPVALALPAFETFLPSDGWDVETLRQGQDGYWYYRGIQRSSSPVKNVYVRSTDLALPGEAVSVGAFRNSALPEPLDHAPPVLRFVLERVFGLSGQDQVTVAAIISPEFSSTRYFAKDAALSGNPEHLVELTGYYIHTSTGSHALAILPDGRGMVGDSRSLEAGKIMAFSCPPLPEGFVYTGIGLSGNSLIAAWEEQQGWNVGSAGLMIIHSQWENKNEKE
ncbi:MAG: hypothetical protein LBK43_04595 [Treponema sp.]|nr:hypothetical protein [Treponema sp.]